jgi:hypothetical protein
VGSRNVMRFTFVGCDPIFPPELAGSGNILNC